MYNIGSLNIWKEEKSDTTHTDELRGVSITEMSLSPRSYNSLKRAGCNTVGDIMDRMEEDGNGLRKIRNLGARSETEIKEMLEKLKKEYRFTPDARPRRRLAKPSYKALERPVEDYRLSVSSLKRLKAAGVFYVKDLYTEKMKEEPGWYAVRELFAHILEEE